MDLKPNIAVKRNVMDLNKPGSRIVISDFFIPYHGVDGELLYIVIHMFIRNRIKDCKWAIMNNIR